MTPSDWFWLWAGLFIAAPLLPFLVLVKPKPYSRFRIWLSRWTGEPLKVSWFGAKPDGKDCSAEIQAAFDECIRNK